MVEREIVQLHLDMRPQTLDDVRHQEAVVGRIKSELKTGTFPHATMFTGSSGVGKTTVARILRDELGCDAFDYVEANMADKRGIDEIRSFASSVGMAPMGKCRVYVLDECHQITKTGQQALLKVLEDCPKHAYFILLTSEPTKLIPAVKTRCSVYKFLAMNRKQSVGFVMQAACTIGKLTDNDPPKKRQWFNELAETIAEYCKGSQRMALVMLQSALACATPAQGLASVESAGGDEKTMMDLFKSIAEKNWHGCKSILNGMWDTLSDDHEGSRRALLGLAGSALVKGWAKCPNGHVLHIIDCFESNNFDSGRAGFVASVYVACEGGN